MWSSYVLVVAAAANAAVIVVAVFEFVVAVAAAAAVVVVLVAFAEEEGDEEDDSDDESNAEDGYITSSTLEPLPGETVVMNIEDLYDSESICVFYKTSGYFELISRGVPSYKYSKISDSNITSLFLSK